MRSRTIQPSSETEDSASNWPIDQPAELDGLSGPIINVDNNNAECISVDKVADSSVTQLTTVTEHRLIKDREMSPADIKDLLANVIAVFQQETANLKSAIESNSKELGKN